MGDYGHRIKKAREAAKMTQEQLGTKIGVTGVTIMRYEKDKREPSQAILKKIADALGVSVAYLEGIESIEVRAIMDAIGRKDTREFERLLGLTPGSIIDMDPELKDGESLFYAMAHDDEEANRMEAYLELFRNLNPSGQKEAVKRVEELAEIPRYQKEKNPAEGE